MRDNPSESALLESSTSDPQSILEGLAVTMLDIAWFTCVGSCEKFGLEVSSSCMPGVAVDVGTDNANFTLEQHISVLMNHKVSAFSDRVVTQYAKTYLFAIKLLESSIIEPSTSWCGIAR